MSTYNDLVGPSGGLKVEIVAGAGAGGAGDASAANQTSQITQATATNTVLGIKTHAASTETGAGAVSAMQVFKQISASLQALVSAFTGSTVDTEDGNIAGGQAAVALVAGLAQQWNGSNWERVTRPGLSASVSVTRPSNTTAYGAGDVVGVTGGGTAAMTLALAAISGSSIMITSVRLQRNAAAVISGEVAYRLHLFNVTQPAAQIDNDVFDVVTGDEASYLGYVDLVAPIDLGSTLISENNAINKHVKLAGTSLFGVLQTIGGYIPVSAAVHVVTVHAVQL